VAVGGGAPALRVWVDAQLPPALARQLTAEHGVDARHVFDLGLAGADDPPVFEAARAAGVAAVVTKDEDFVLLLERRGPPPAVVWVTAGNVRNAELLRIVRGAWPRVAELLAAGEPLVEVSRRD
jgi:predicted nuclease of predicted toxin-antitoxin system